MRLKEQLEIYFNLVDDVRNQSYIKYKLSDILFLLVCGMVCGCSDLEEIIVFAEEREDFFKSNSTLPEIPSLMTLTNILKRLNPDRLELCLCGIFRNVLNQSNNLKNKQICIDGKTICSTASMTEYDKPIHIITALLADSYISLGQITVDDKSNEIPAVREMIDLMDIKDCVLTMDAMHCQKETAEKIRKNKGNYVLQLKKNQGSFYEDVYAMFEKKYMAEDSTDNEYEVYQTIEKSHGRIEHRICYVLTDTEYFTDYLVTWKDLKRIFAVKRIVEKNGKKSEEISCYLSSKAASAEELLSYTRKHWQIESFHWLLDVICNEDSCKVRNKNMQICLNILRKYAISIVKNYIENHNVKRKAISANMRKCMLNPEYLQEILLYYCRK